MLTLILSTITILLYASAGALQFAHLYQKDIGKNSIIVILAISALLIQAYLLHQWIDVSHGQNLTFFNVLSQVSWLMVGVLLLGMCFWRIQNLGVFIYPFAALALLLELLFPSQHIVVTSSNPKELIHILSAFLIVSFFTIIVLHTIMVAIQDKLLRAHRLLALLRALPPLETMETILFQMILFGFILLSLVLLLSFVFFPNFYNLDVLHHIIFGVLAWVVFAILLCGRLWFGWRGQKAIRGTLFGFSLLVLSYIFVILI